MSLKHTLTACTLAFTVAIATQAQASDIKPFVTGSYQQLLNDYVGKAFVLIIWSVDCPSCLKDMEMLRSVHQEYPELNLVLLSTDEADSLPQQRKLLQSYQLTDLPSWSFADEDAQKLRYEIDPAWFGELPRSYFFKPNHERSGKSGALTKAQLLEMSKN